MRNLTATKIDLAKYIPLESLLAELPHPPDMRKALSLVRQGLLPQTFRLYGRCSTPLIKVTDARRWIEQRFKDLPDERARLLNALGRLATAGAR